MSLHENCYILTFLDLFSVTDLGRNIENTAFLESVTIPNEFDNLTNVDNLEQVFSAGYTVKYDTINQLFLILQLIHFHMS